MIIEQKRWKKAGGWEDVGLQSVGQKADLVLAFGGTEQVKDKATYDQLRTWYPKAEIVLGSTAGDILGTHIFDDGVVVTAISFRDTKVKTYKVEVAESGESFEAGAKIGRELSGEGLAHVMTFTDGLKVNGTKFVAGVQGSLPKGVTLTGGLAGDGTAFKETALGLNGPATSGGIVAVGFYGSSLKVGYGSAGGWDPFGVERIITKSHDNVLYEFDGKPALALFKQYLGDKAKDLPASGLFFPLSIKVKTPSGKELNIVRSFSAVNEKEQSLTFFGDVPEGSPSQLMKTNFDGLVDGASEAAKMSLVGLGSEKAEFAVLVSCIGRRVVLKDRTEEELEEVERIIGPQAQMIGFYSYGELCPSVPTEKECQMHNQTMTITTFKEI